MSGAKLSRADSHLVEDAGARIPGCAIALGNESERATAMRWEFDD